MCLPPSFQHRSGVTRKLPCSSLTQNFLSNVYNLFLVTLRICSTCYISPRLFYAYYIVCNMDLYSILHSNLLQFMLQFLPYALHQGPLTFSWNERTKSHGVMSIQTCIIRVNITVELVIIIRHCSPCALSR